MYDKASGFCPFVGLISLSKLTVRVNADLKIYAVFSHQFELFNGFDRRTVKPSFV